MSSDEGRAISLGDVVVIQRFNYLRTHKIGARVGGKRGAGDAAAAPKVPRVQLGKETVNLSAAIGCKFGSAFRMVRQEEGGRKSKEWSLEEVDPSEADFDDDLTAGEGAEEGEDNRELVDENSSQKLSKEEIESMKSEGRIGREMVAALTEKSESFAKKTRFSQAKFLKKKTKKYFEFLVIRKPTIRLLMEIQYRTDPTKVMNLRSDSLAQLLNQVNVRAGGRYLVYETGCQGLVVAAALERVSCGDGDGEGEGKDGKVVHVFQTGNPQTQSLNAMNFSASALSNLSTLNMYHLRSLEQGVDITAVHQRVNGEEKAKAGEGEEADASEEEDKGDEKEGKEMEGSESDKEMGTSEKPADSAADELEKSGAAEEKKPVPHRQKLREQSVLSYGLLRDRAMDGLIVACRQHPTAVLLSLLPYLAPSRPWAVFSPYKEPLLDAYMRVKEAGAAVAVTLSESWLREYQVLPGRTHPAVNMSGGGGYLLTGIKVDPAEPEGGEEAAAACSNGDSGRKKNKRFRRR